MLIGCINNTKNFLWNSGYVFKCTFGGALLGGAMGYLGGLLGFGFNNKSITCSEVLKFANSLGCRFTSIQMQTDLRDTRCGYAFSCSNPSDIEKIITYSPPSQQTEITYYVIQGALWGAIVGASIGLTVGVYRVFRHPNILHTIQNELKEEKIDIPETKAEMKAVEEKPKLEVVSIAQHTSSFFGKSPTGSLLSADINKESNDSSSLLEEYEGEEYLGLSWFTPPR